MILSTMRNSQLPQVASQGTQMPTAAKMFMRLHWPLLAKNLKQGRPFVTQIIR